MVALSLFFTSSLAALSSKHTGKTVRYRCPGHLGFSADFSEGDSSAQVRIWNGTEYMLTLDERWSAGSLYRAGNVILFTTHNKSSLTIGDVIHTNCVQTGHSTTKTSSRR